MRNVVVYTDGGARGNPGRAGAGVVIQENECTLAALKKYLGANLTNNAAEYEALILALTELKAHGLANENVEVRMDSELVIRQLRGEYQIKEQSLWPLYMRVHNLLVANFAVVTFTHVPREQNREADRLANQAIDAAT